MANKISKGFIFIGEIDKINDLSFAHTIPLPHKNDNLLLMRTLKKHSMDHTHEQTVFFTVHNQSLTPFLQSLFFDSTKTAFESKPPKDRIHP